MNKTNKTIKAKDAVPGMWYETYGVRILFINEVDGNYWFSNIYSDQFAYDKDDNITPLPDCTGWDWEPTPKHPPVPEGWRELRGDEEIKNGDRYRFSSEWKDVCNNIGSLRGWFDYPHIRRIEPQYRPFASAEEFDPFSNRIVINIGTGTRRRIDHWSDTHVNGMTWDVAFRKYKFLDGTPFGVRINDEQRKNAQGS